MRLALLLLTTLTFTGLAQTQPGQGIEVQPLQSAIPEERFQTDLVVRALQALGYQVAPIKEMEYAGAHQAIARGEGTFMANHWSPLHTDFLLRADPKGERIVINGVYSADAMQGYLIDKATADQYQISQLTQLQDPKLAKLFDQDGDGKAELAGCNPGWGCKRVIQRHLKRHGLDGTVRQLSGDYSAQIAETLARYRQGKPVLFYAWTPYWVAGIMVPDQDVTWLKLPGASPYGFQSNNQHIIANRDFVDANPAAAALFQVMKLPVNDISRQNLQMQQGQHSRSDVDRHVDQWIAEHQQTFDQWLEKARAAAN